MHEMGLTRAKPRVLATVDDVSNATSPTASLSRSVGRSAGRPPVTARGSQDVQRTQPIRRVAGTPERSPVSPFANRADLDRSLSRALPKATGFRKIRRRP
jgi:hypothetical protein